MRYIFVNKNQALWQQIVTNNDRKFAGSVINMDSLNLFIPTTTLRGTTKLIYQLEDALSSNLW